MTYKVFGIKLPPRLGHGSFDPKVRPLIEADRTLRESLLPVLDARLVLYRTFRELDNRTRKAAHADPDCQRLMTAPGVGFVTALTFKAAVDDPTRFKRSRTVAAHFGLTPRRFQSGELDLEGQPFRLVRSDRPLPGPNCCRSCRHLSSNLYAGGYHRRRPGWETSAPDKVNTRSVVQQAAGCPGRARWKSRT
jgi:hypothetical protein